MRFSMVQPVTDMTVAALGPRLAAGVCNYLDMFHDNAVFEFPFSVGGAVQINGKQAMAQYLDKIEGATIFDRFDLRATYPLQHGGMVLEYHASARAGTAQTPFDQDYVTVVGIDAGRIRHYREYYDPLNIPGIVDEAGSTALDATPLEGPVTDLSHMLRIAFADQLAPPADVFVEMFADDSILECPFAPRDAMRRVAGRREIAAYYARLTTVQASDGMVLTAHHITQDPELAVLEYDGLVRNARNQNTYRQRYLAVVRVAYGRVTLFREYWNPLPLVASFGPAGPTPVQPS